MTSFQMITQMSHNFYGLESLVLFTEGSRLTDGKKQITTNGMTLESACGMFLKTVAQGNSTVVDLKLCNNEDISWLSNLGAT